MTEHSLGHSNAPEDRDGGPWNRSHPQTEAACTVVVGNLLLLHLMEIWCTTPTCPSKSGQLGRSWRAPADCPSFLGHFFSLRTTANTAVGDSSMADVGPVPQDESGPEDTRMRSPTPVSGDVHEDREEDVAGEESQTSQHPAGTDRIFSCPKCDKAFRTRSTMNSHLRHTHSGIKPHSCEHCGRAFSRNSDLRRHLRNIHFNEMSLKSKKQTKNRNDLGSQAEKEEGEFLADSDDPSPGPMEDAEMDKGRPQIKHIVPPNPNR